MTTLPLRVAVIAFDGISPFHLSVPCLVFGDACRDLVDTTVTVCADDRHALTTTAGFSLHIGADLSACDGADLVVVPSWHDVTVTAPDAVLDALRRAAQRGALVAGLCLGAYVVAQAGLLAGGMATTHWAYLDDFSQRFANVALAPDALYISHHHIITSAGTAAALDCCLHLLRQLRGAEIANRVARRMVLAAHRPGGQAQYIDTPLPVHRRDQRLAVLLDQVRSTLEQPHTLDSLATRAALSRRHFSRQFRAVTGTTLGQWLTHERLQYAQRLLEGGDLDIDAIASRCGLGSATNLRLLFKRAFGITPSQWRQQFRASGVNA